MNYYKKNKIFKQYDARNVVYNNRNNYDLRFIVLRHAERIDQALGSDWYDKIFQGVPSATLQAHKHPLLPSRLPYRPNTLLYILDPPITRSGEQQSYIKGQKLSLAGVTVDYCYSSPAARSVLTANAVLAGMNQRNVPIRIEPYLFEPLNWNSAIFLLDKMQPFMSSGDWKQSGYNVDRDYHRLGNYLRPNENEVKYYDRTRELFRSFEHRHSNMLPRRYYRPNPKLHTTVLIVGHASSTEIFEMIALQRAFNRKSFIERTNQVPFLHTTILDRNAINHSWSQHSQFSHP